MNVGDTVTLSVPFNIRTNKPRIGVVVKAIKSLDYEGKPIEYYAIQWKTRKSLDYCSDEFLSLITREK